MALNLLFNQPMRTVAIIDDEAAQRLVMRGLVEESGFTVVAEAADGSKAVEVCKTFSPDILLVDVTMPVMDGIEAASEINRLCPTPVVILTARDDEETIRRAALAGVMAYLLKPVRKEEIAPTIELAISRFSEYRNLKKENTELKNTLQARKTIEKAKGLLMEREKLSENEAFARIRKISMDKRKSMTEIAEVIILAFEKKDRG